MKAAAPVKAADIKAALLKHYAPPGWRVFFEVSNDTGTRARRWIDAVAVGIWPSTGHEIVGIEIKVSRSDLQRELANPGKAQSLMKYCTRWCLACPAELATTDDVPANWGILAYQSNGTLKRKKQPPLLEPEPLTSGFMMAILRQHEQTDSALVERLVAERTRKHEEQFEQRVERAAAMRVRDVSNRTERALKTADRLMAITGDDPMNWAFDTDALASAYLFFKQSGLDKTSETWGSFGNLSRHLTSALQALAVIESDPRLTAVREAIAAAKAAAKDAA